MRLDSKWFDSIRVKPEEEETAQTEDPVCDAPGCDKPGLHRAPKGRRHEGEYYLFCLDHVRQYNKSYNYFSGMSDDAVHAYQKDAMTGHRPTWQMRDRTGPAADDRANPRRGRKFRFRDPFDVSGLGDSEADGREKRHLLNGQRQALETLGLDDTADADQIRARYKDLVKRHHPDSNGGDRSNEARLRKTIQAYRYLRKTGMC